MRAAAPASINEDRSFDCDQGPPALNKLFLAFDCSHRPLLPSTPSATTSPSNPLFPFPSFLPSFLPSLPTHLHQFSLWNSVSKMSSALEIRDKQIAAAEGKLKAREHFDSIFPLLLEEIVEYLDKINLPENAIEWFKEVNPSNSLARLDSSATMILVEQGADRF
jgi:hypothetical protein